MQEKELKNNTKQANILFYITYRINRIGEEEIILYLYSYKVKYS